jgi:hypothetical protein
MNERELAAHDGYEHVERGELAGGVSDEPIDVRASSHVSGEGDSLDPRRGCLRGCLICAPLVDVHDGNRAARRRERSCDRTPDAATTATDDERALPLEHSPHAAILQTPSKARARGACSSPPHRPGLCAIAEESLEARYNCDVAVVAQAFLGL